MRIARRLKIFPFLIFFLLGCDLTQFNPKPHRDRYEKERIRSEQKLVQLTDDGQLAPAPPAASPEASPPAGQK